MTASPVTPPVLSIYRAASDAADFVTDFTKGAGGDMADLREILQTFPGSNGANAFSGGYLEFAPSASRTDTLVRIDTDGGSNSLVTLATLSNMMLEETDVLNYELV